MGQARMRELWFGRDEFCSTDGDSLRLTLDGSRGRLVSVLEGLSAQLDQQAELPLPEEIATLTTNSLADVRRELATTGGSRSGSPTRPLRVVLMGRTMAGKSTLLEALTDGDGSRRGDGRQRFSRVVEERPLRVSEHITLIDTPGVGALDGPEDYEIAFAEVPRADLVVWVAANDSTTEDTAVALRHISLLGKPVILLLNCRAALPPGRRRDKFLRDPDRVFAMSEGHVRRISGIIHGVGGTTPPSFEVHAEAAYLASAGTDRAAELHQASRIQHFTDALLLDYQRNLEQRLALADADAVRTSLDQAAAALEDAEIRARDGLATHGQISDSLAAKWNRSIDRHDSLARERLRARVSRRRDWADDIDVESDVAAAWKRESELLVEELNEELVGAGALVTKALQEIAHDLSDEWRKLGDSPVRLRPDTGRSSVWGNRALKVGGRFGLALGGAGLGAVVFGPAGAVVGGLTGFLAPHWDSIADKLFRSRAEVIRRRRHEVTKKLGPILDKIEADSLDVLSSNMERTRQSSVRIMQARRAGEQRTDEMIDEIHSANARVGALLSSVDTATAITLASMSGRSRLTTGISAAYRLPGRAILVAVDEPELYEQTLFPVTGMVERIVPIPRDGPPHRRAAYALLGLLDGPVTLLQMTPTRVRASPNGSVPEGVRETLGVLISFATQTDTKIEGDDT